MRTQAEPIPEFEVVLVGAGPIGLELAAALKVGRVNYLHLEAGQLAQTITWYPRQARFFSSPERIAIAGVELVTPDQTKATREQYLAYLRGVAMQYNLKVNTFEKVIGIERDRLSGMFVVASSYGKEPRKYLSRHLVLAVGDMHQPRMLHIPGEELGNVSHYFEEPNMFFGKRLLIVGGRNSAVEAALRCYRAGATVSISYRQEHFDSTSVKYWLLPELEALIKHGEIAYLPRTIPVRITPRQVDLVSTAEPPAAGQTLDTDFVLLLTGYEQDTTLFDLAGVELVGESRAPRLDEKTMMTNVPNLYVIGTAAAGTQTRTRLFIETCHPHVSKVFHAITGDQPAQGLVNHAVKQFGLPES